jgi:hypothetical protein
MTKVPGEIRQILAILRKLEDKAVAALEATPLRSVTEALDVLEFAIRLERLVLALPLDSSPLPRARGRRQSPRGRRRTR